jgi:hypothetical protein
MRRPARPPVVSLKDRIRNFARTRLGYGVFLTVIILILAGLVVLTGDDAFLMAVSLVIFALALPIYLGWNRRLRTLAVVAAVILLLVPPVAAAPETGQLLVPSPAVSSADGVLQNGTVNPFSGPGVQGRYNFTVEVYPTRAPDNGTVTNVTLYVTNCPFDNFTQHNNCHYNPDYFLQTRINLSASQRRMPEVTLSYDVPLPSGEILDYILEADYVYNVTSNGTVRTYTGTSCAGLSSNGTCGWMEGPVTATFAQTYGLVLLGFYESFLFLAIIVYVALGLYSYLKLRERRRLAAAARNADGTSTPPLPSGQVAERTCPSCGAVVKPDEDFCWKCGKSLPPSSPN